MTTLVLFAHGKESGPLSSKIKILSSIAEKYGYQTLSPDYSNFDNPDERVKYLLNLDLPPYNNLVMVGSSMGGYVSAVASETLQPTGLFLMAPAFYMPGYENQNPVSKARLTSVVIGWHDEVIPASHGIKFAEKNSANLHVLSSDHRLINVLPELGELFTHFLLKSIKII